MTPWPTVIKNKIKIRPIYNDSVWAGVPAVCIVDAQRIYTPSSAHSSQGGRLCLWKQLYHIFNSGGVLTGLKNWFSGLGTTIFSLKKLGLESFKDMAFIRQWGWIMGNVGLSQSRGHFQKCLFDKLPGVSKKKKKKDVLVMVSSK